MSNETKVVQFGEGRDEEKGIEKCSIISMCLVMSHSTLVHFLSCKFNFVGKCKANQKCTKLETKVVLKVVQFGGRER
jgi:hypothetical protein